MSQFFLYFRMAVYIGAVPFAAYLGGSFDHETGLLTVDVNRIFELASGVGVAVATFLSGRVAKARGGAT